jgi:TM2 domain-containing membrane protein YozV
MKGTILDYSIQTNSGIISAADGKRYKFVDNEWKSAESTPRLGMNIDFEPSGENAVGIYFDASVGRSTDTRKIVAAILALVLGAFGAHKFYLGIKTPAIIMLCVSVFGFILIIPMIIMGLIGFIESIIYLTKSDEDFNQTYIVGKKAWF